jgi:DNA-binding transcriptional MerR regulator
MAEYRVDELAREAGTTVRNVRAYQDRGLLPPPRRIGRVGVYDDAHLARLRLIARLLERGYTIANIRELVVAWEHGRDLHEVLGLEEAVTGPWSDEVPGWITADELDELFPDGDDDTIARAVELGYLVPESDGRFRVTSPRLLRSGAELVAAGVSLRTVLDLGGLLRGDVDRIAARFVEVIGGELLDTTPTPELAAAVRRLRPLAQVVVTAELARAMQHHTLELLGDQLAAALDLTPSIDEAS